MFYFFFPMQDVLLFHVSEMYWALIHATASHLIYIT